MKKYINATLLIVLIFSCIISTTIYASEEKQIIENQFERASIEGKDYSKDNINELINILNTNIKKKNINGSFKAENVTDTTVTIKFSSDNFEKEKEITLNKIDKQQIIEETKEEAADKLNKADKMMRSFVIKVGLTVIILLCGISVIRHRKNI